MKRLFRPLIFLCLLMLFALPLSACAGLGDYDIRLAGDYEIWRMSGWNRQIVLRVSETGANPVIGSYIDKVAFDNEYICAQKLEVDARESPPVNENSARSYYVIVVESGEVLGPMTEAEFNDWYAALGRTDTPLWFDAGDEHALHDSWEELNPGQSYE